MTTLHDLLKLNLVDHLFLHQMREPGAKKAFLAESQQDILKKVEMLIRLAKVNKEIEELCKDPQLDAHWNLAYDGFVRVLKEEEQTKELFVYSHPSIPSFDLLRGIYFFYHAQQIRKESKEETNSERSLLKQAMAYSSIQAMQRYHELLYQKIEQDPSNAEALLREIIQNCKTMLEFYGSFSYCMLTEAYCRYAHYLSQNNKPEEAQMLYQAGLSAFDYAERFLKLSQPSIYNASFGKGLMASNSLGLGTVSEIRQYLQEKMPYLLFKKHTPAEDETLRPLSSLSPEA